MLRSQILGVILTMTLVAGTLGIFASLSAYVDSSSFSTGTVIQAPPSELGPAGGFDKGPARLAP
jgi:hypothetical protein